MDLPVCNDHLEAEPLKLTAEQFPLPCSLRDAVIDSYTTLGSSAPGVELMALPEVITYLRSEENLNLTPMQSFLAQTEAIGDSAMPSAEQVAILNWLGAAFEQWESSFPLEQPLVSELRRMKPLAAKLAITDPDFLTPGQHPLHLILDSLQLAAVGWQLKLGRIGESVQKQLFNAVENALACFEAEGSELADLASLVLAATERDIARASRMAQRMIETEQGRIKVARAKRIAAAMINTALEQFSTPPGIGEFLRGAWYDSAQLVLLKFGEASSEWAQMGETTTDLLNSVQLPENEDDPQMRQQFFEVVTIIPTQLRRWLLSLQHDSDEIDNAIGMVEYAHLQILRNRDLELEHTTLIPVVLKEAPTSPGATDPVKAGHWFRIIRNPEGEQLRVRLVLQIDETGELLFANQAGLKVLRQSLEEFARLLAGGQITMLDSGASFSRSLARAAGIETMEELAAVELLAAMEG